MKWIGLVLALAACGARDVVAPAPTFSESTAHVGVATNGKDYVVPFTTNAIGDLTVTADWTPKSAAAYYVLRVFYGDALVCSVSKGSPQVAGHYVCARGCRADAGRHHGGRRNRLNKWTRQPATPAW